MKNQSLKSNKGFSLVELIVVIAIMAILVGIMAPSLMKQINKSRLSKDKQTLDTIAQAINNALADPDAYEAFNKDGYTAGMGLADFIALDTSDATDVKFSEEVKDNLKGKSPADIKFSSKDYKGKKGTDVVVYLDDNENLVLVLAGNNASVGDDKKVLYNPDKDAYDKVVGGTSTSGSDSGSGDTTTP